jgi:uncharacterized membrane protein
MSQVKVSYRRHLAKTISYRILSTSIGFIAMWWASGSIKVGAAFGIVELLYKPIQYYIHERIWYKWIKFGLSVEPERKKKVVHVETKIEPTTTEKKPKIEVKSEPQQTGKKVLNYSSNR